MSKRYLLILVLFLLLAHGNRTGAQTDPRAPGALYLQAITQVNVTMSKDGTVVGAMSFPQGTHVTVRAEGQTPQMTAPGRFQFNGNVELRAMPLSGIPAGANGRPAADILSRAPIVLAAQGVSLVVENVQ